MSTIQVQAPSGLVASVRGMKVKEINILADKGRAQRLETFDDILAACVVGIDDPGPLAPMFMGDNGKPNWGKVTIADRFTLLVNIRAASTRLGTDYEFKHKCGACGEIYTVKITVPDDLDFKMFSDEDIETIRGGRPFEATLSSGEVFTWRTMFGEDERRAAKRARKAMNEGGEKDGRSGVISVAVAERLVSFAGEKKKGKILRMIEELHDGALDEIMAAFDEHDGGYDDMHEVDCPECGEYEDHKIPFAGDFWRSSRKSRSKPSED